MMVFDENKRLVGMYAASCLQVLRVVAGIYGDLILL